MGVWVVKYGDGTMERIEADDYDPQKGEFLKNGKPMAYVTKALVKSVRLLGEAVEELRPIPGGFIEAR
jgi:hypothetical protein